MPRETVQICELCGSLCRAIECVDGKHVYLRPLVDGSLGIEEGRSRILSMLAEAKFAKTRLDAAIMMLHHAEEFLQNKGHKFMHLEVKRCLDTLIDRRHPENNIPPPP